MDQVDEAKNLGNPVVDRKTEQCFTPGPWKVTPSGFFEGVCVRTEDNAWVAQVWSAHGGVELPRDANARLIAAAPALYKAVSELIDAMEMQEGRETQELHITQPVARQIWDEAKARGRESLALVAKPATGPAGRPISDHPSHGQASEPKSV